LPGNIYIADSSNHVIRKVDTSGNISTYAGNGSPGFTGDGTATSNSLSSPYGVAVDASGDLYIADSGNQRVRKVNTSGQMTTIAGTGSAGFDGDGMASAHNLNFPTAVAVDSSGNVYIADEFNQRIRRVDTSGQMTTVAGNGTAAFSDGTATTSSLNLPTGVAADSAGNIFIADSANQRIREVSGGNIMTIAGNGSYDFGGDGSAGVDAQIDSPAGVATVPTGGFVFSDLGNQRIRRVDSGGNINTIAGTGSCAYDGEGLATTHSLCYPYGVARDSAGNVYIADSNNQRIRKVDTSGNMSTIAGNGTAGFSGDGGAATAASLNYPSGVAADAGGNVYIADTGNQRIRKVNTTGTISTIAGNGNVGFNGDGAATGHRLYNPAAIAVDSSGNLYIADTDNELIRKVSGGNMTTIAGNGTEGFSGDGIALNVALDGPSGVAVDSAGNVYIADTYNQRIRKVDTSSNLGTIAGGNYGFAGDGASAASARFANPSSVSIDSTGNVLVADLNNQRIRSIYGPTTATLASSSNPSIYQQLVTFTATVSSSGAMPTGTVFFKGGTTVLGSGPVDSTGHATFATSTLTLGQHKMTASYGGDANVGPSSSSVVVQTVNRWPTSTSLSSSPNPSTYGQPVKFTAVVTSSYGTPTGTVTFKNGSIILGSASLDSTGTASFTSSVIAVGSRFIVAVYNASGTNFFGSTSPTLTQTVNKASTSTSLSSSPNPSTYGQTVTFTSVVTSSAGIPTGTVTFKNGSTVLGSASLDSTGTATTNSSAVPAGSRFVVATYSGGAGSNYAASTSPTLTQTVNKAASTTALTCTPNPSVSGQVVTLTATVTSLAGKPTGTVTFKNSRTIFGSSTLDSTGKATLLISTLPTGTTAIQAAYAGDANFKSSNSTTVNQQVN